MKNLRNFPVFLLAFALFVPTLYAQSDSASVVGTVTDSTGGTIPTASVIIRNTQTGAVITLQTGMDGKYASPFVRPGAYTITVEFQGFQKIVQTITLEVDQHPQVNFVLKPGSIEQTIEVAADVVLLETQNSSLGNVRPTQAILDLPLNGRNFVQLFYLASGVSTQGGGNTMSPSLSNQTGVQGGAVNGGRLMANNYQFDGIQSQDNEQGVLVFSPTPDAIQEFKVQTSGLDASFGRSGGGVINLVMKSGGNDFHFVLFEFLRNSALDAKNFFDNPKKPIPPFRQNQFGGAGGGHIIKGKTFFFADYQGTRVVQAQTLLSTVPTAQMKQGDFSQLGVTLYDPLTTKSTNGVLSRTIFPGAKIDPARFNPTGLNLIKLYPDPNQSGLTSNYLNDASRRGSPDQFDIRVDHSITTNDPIFTRVSYFNQPAYNPGFLPGLAVGAGPSFPGNYNTAGRQIVIGGSHTFSSKFLYEARIGYSRLNIQITGDTQGTNLAQKVGIPGINDYGSNQSGLGPITITGFTGLGQSQFVPSSKVTNNWQTNHQMSYIHGKHTFKWGYDVLWRGLNTFAASTPMGTFAFTGQFTQNPTSAAKTGSALADLLLGYEASASMLMWQEFGVRRQEHAAYFNDDIRVSGKLTLNVGVRWDLQTRLREVHDRMSAFVPSLSDVFPVNSTQFPHSTTESANYKDFGPRFGLAYQLTPKTVIRTAYGIFYWAPPVSTSTTGVVNAPFTGSINVTNNVTATDMTTVRPISAGLPLMTPGKFSSAGASFTYVPYEGQTNSYMQQRNISLQRLITNDLVLTLAYVGSRGLHLSIYPDINQPVPGAGAAAARRKYPNLGSAQAKFRAGDSYYNSGQVILERRFARGIGFQASYTWAHSIDNGSVDVQGGSPQNIYDYRAERGNSDFDLRHRFVGSFSYELPFGPGKLIGKSWHGAMRHLFGGWQMNGMLAMYTGAYFTPTSGTNTLGSGANTQRPNRIADGNLPSDQRTIQRWFDTSAFAIPAAYTYGNSGRNILIGPGTKQVDASVFKKIPLFKESQRLEIRCEAFNLFNTPQFNNPGTAIGTASAGVISGAGTPQFLNRTSRQVQMALKLYF